MRNILVKICFFLALVIVLPGCYPYYYGGPQYQRQNEINYDIALVEVQRPKEAKARYGEQKIDRIIENGVNKYYFEDEMIKIIWLPVVYQLSFVVNNKTEYSIRIVWDEAAYVDENGLSLKMMHSGVKYADRNSSQPPSVVVRKGSLADFIVPTDYVYWREGSYSYYTSIPGGWETKPLFPTKEGTYSSNPEPILNIFSNKYLYKTFQILIPFQIEGVTNDYIFTFKINDILINYVSAVKMKAEKDVIEKKASQVIGKNIDELKLIFGDPVSMDKFQDGKIVWAIYRIENKSIKVLFSPDTGKVGSWTYCDNIGSK